MSLVPTCRSVVLACSSLLVYIARCQMDVVWHPRVRQLQLDVIGVPEVWWCYKLDVVGARVCGYVEGGMCFDAQVCGHGKWI